MTSETKIRQKKALERLWIRGNIWGRVKCTGLEIGPQCMGGPNRGMYTLPHSYIFKNCFNFCHSTTLSHQKRVPKVSRKVKSNSGFVHHEKFHPYMKWILHLVPLRNIVFKSSYTKFTFFGSKIDIHWQLRLLTANYLAVFIVTSITIYK